jgi:hypothetical protein
MRWAGHAAPMVVKGNVFSLFVEKLQEKIPLGRIIRRWVDNIKMDIGEIRLVSIDWIGLAQDREK